VTTTTSQASPASALDPNPDAHLYLEEVEGAEALAWVRKENERSLAVLENDARYQGLLRRCAGDLDVEAERIPYGVDSRQGQVYNFWQDETHERGIWRRHASVADYAAGFSETWETLLDLDALAKAEGGELGLQGRKLVLASGAMTDCLLSLSDGGKDAVRVREYSTSRKVRLWPGSVSRRVRHSRSQELLHLGGQRTRCCSRPTGAADTPSTLTESRAIPSW
jgi:prolyl oligopeptidase